MKKVFFSLAVVCSLALVSCGGNKAAEATDSESVAAEVVEESVVAPGDSETAVVEAAEVVEAPVADSAK